jgi:hypothetical protein
VRGREAVIRRFAGVLADDRDCDLRFEAATVCGPFGLCRWRLDGRAADGEVFAVEGVDVYEFSGDLIRVRDVYRKA